MGEKNNLIAILVDAFNRYRHGRVFKSDRPAEVSGIVVSSSRITDVYTYYTAHKQSSTRVRGDDTMPDGLYSVDVIAPSGLRKTVYYQGLLPPPAVGQQVEFFDVDKIEL